MKTFPGRVRYVKRGRALIQLDTPEGLRQGLFTLDEGDDEVERGDAVEVTLSEVRQGEAVVRRVR